MVQLWVFNMADKFMAKCNTADSAFLLCHCCILPAIRFWYCSFKKPADSEVTQKEEERRNLASALFGGIRASPKVLNQSFLCGFVGCFTVVYKLCFMYKKIMYHVKTRAMLKCNMRNGKLQEHTRELNRQYRQQTRHAEPFLACVPENSS